MIIESIDPMREEYIRIFEMMYNAIERSSGIAMPAAPEFRRVKFSLCEESDPDGDNCNYYVPVDPIDDPVMWIRMSRGRATITMELDIIFPGRDIDCTYRFMYTPRYMKTMFGTVVAKLNSLNTSSYHQVFWRYALPERREPSS